MPDTSEIMVIAAHPDDAEFGAAGSVAKWTREGRRVVYIVCTSGEKGANDPDTRLAQLAEIREKEQTDAAAVLGVSGVVFLRYPDQELEDTPPFPKVDRETDSKTSAGHHFNLRPLPALHLAQGPPYRRPSDP